ncbi:class I SAM-dependent methyltransferase [Variovorax sp. J22P271]|uniref:class I SAM-dependent methyltransferase n=1 Tax=Variovorax davisae TaxID=3053515 RepID=UPI002577E864|nr:class I SAM-dependent methyltransferase [Variovorax sp. J22P271]MDM0032140.1 class I SAM-dependent methyltransferase [Variovorax sp. J22P271]
MSPGERDGGNLEALRLLAGALQTAGYRFTTVSPESHRRYLQRRAHRAGANLRDIFGWSLSFAPEDLSSDIRSLAEEAGALTTSGGKLRSRVRFSTLGDSVYLHSAYPTLEPASVFFGPDTYRFISLIQRELAARPAVRRVVDIGCGSGAGGLEAIRALRAMGQFARLEMTDVNPRALEYATVNARLAGVEDAELRQADLFAGLSPGADLIIANPPYLMDRELRAYRHGGGSLGAGLSQRIVSEGVPMLAPGGRLVLYTGSVIVGGEDLLLASLRPMLERDRLEFRYAELDPDVFAEELDQPGYEGAERIAVVSLVVEAPTEGR